MPGFRPVAIAIVAAGLAAQQTGAICERPPAALAVDSAAAQQVTPPEPPTRGLVMRLSEGGPGGQAPPPVVATPQAAPLGDVETQRLLDRLPPLEAGATAAPFAFPARTLPAPRTGRTVAMVFPPGAATARPPSGAEGRLEVLRRAPEGEVGLAPNLSVTFSQPMVAVSSVEELSRTPVPVRLTPLPPGEWRWVGARTATFEPEGRFPMATDFSAEVPAGTRSATGAALAAAVRWTFSTPPLDLETSYPPDEVTGRLPVMVAVFDQAVDPARLISSFVVRAQGRSVRPRLASDAELKADRAASAIVRGAQPGRAIALTLADPLPLDTEVTVAIEPGAPSAEGPRATTRRQQWSFRTYGPFRVADHDEHINPFGHVSIALSNPIDAASFRRDQVRVTPPVPEVQASASDRWISLSGPFRPRTTYTVTVSGDLADAFGQRLGRDEALKVAVGPMLPVFHAPFGPLAVLDPAGPPRVSVYSAAYRAIRVRAHAVGPADWEAYQQALRQYRAWDLDRRPPLPGRRVWSAAIPVTGSSDDLIETDIDLAPAVRAGGRQLVIQVEPEPLPSTGGPPSPRRGGRMETAVSWIQVTRLAVDAVADDREVTVWATALADGAPVEGAEVALHPAPQAAPTTATDGGGLCRLPLPAEGASLIVVRKGDDMAMLPRGNEWRPRAWTRTEARAAWRWFVFDDRAIYRPGETVHVKGWVRRVGAGPSGDVEPAGAGSRARFTVRDARSNEIGGGSATLNRFGGFDLSFAVPKEANLGPASIELVGEPEAGEAGATHRHPFQIQDFRTPEFEVKAESEGEPFLVGGHATASVMAAYYAGGPLPGAPAHWTVRAEDGHFAPPGWGDYTFGGGAGWLDDGEGTREATEEFDGTTDATGLHRLRIDFDAVTPPRAKTVTAEATVTDVNRQAWSASTSFVVHPAGVYVGVRMRRPFVQKGQPPIVDLVVTDLDGHAVPGRTVEVRLERVTWEQVGGEWTRRLVDRQDRRLASGTGAVECAFAPTSGGSYLMTSRVSDEAGRPNETVVAFWVAGGEVPRRRLVGDAPVTIVADKEEYRPGDTAELLVVAPFAPAEGLLTLGRSGLVRTERFRVTEATATLRIAIEAAWLPNVHARVDLVGAEARADEAGRADPRVPLKPARASGEIDLAISTRERTLAVEVTPEAEALAPGAKTAISARVVDADGRPLAGAEVALFAVDEAVLSLTGYQLDDPVRLFYRNREAGTEQAGLRGYVLLRTRFDAAAVTPSSKMADRVMERASGGGVGGGIAESVNVALGAVPAPAMAPMEAGGESAPLGARSNFDPLACFVGSAETGADGRVAVPVTLPDNLTRYRIMAVAATDANRFGSGEAALTARLPLMARVSPPRFLNFGDRFELPIVVQNQTSEPMRVRVAVRAANLAFTAGAGRAVEVGAHDRVEVRFPAATEGAGRARIQVAASAGTSADASEVVVPVWTPATSEAFATYGQIDDGAEVQPLKPPSGAIPAFGGLEVTTSSTALQALTDAVLYLVAYPYECAEQLSSRVLAVSALRDVLTAFKADLLPPASEIEAAVARDLARLAAMQNEDGGFGFWRRGEESWPYVSIHVAHALARAKAKGFAVPARALARSSAYLGEIETHFPRHYGPEIRRTLTAYALYVRSIGGDRDAARARRLVAEATVPKLSFEALGWLLGVLSGAKGSDAEVAAIRAFVANRVTETAGEAHFAVSYADGDYLLLNSDRRADAVLLDALIGDQPKSDLIPKLVAGLLAHRKAGRWGNTQENAFVLLALDRYFRAYEAVTPDFVARVWLGDRFAGEAAFRGRTTDRASLSIPMAEMAGPGETRVVIGKEGPGRLYYRIGLRYAPENLRLAPLDRGFVVERRYEAVDDTADVTRDADGTWRVKAGARVRVRLTLVAEARRYHVALSDPLAAGLEPMNPALAVTGTVPDAAATDVEEAGAPGLGGPGRPGAWWRWRRTWFEHQNLRDDRAEAFASLLWEGVYAYSYVARATTPGTFVVPPPRAEEMYAPETFGRGRTDIVVVR